MRKIITTKIRATLIPRLSDIPAFLISILGIVIPLFGGYIGDWDITSRFIVLFCSFITVGAHITVSVKQPDKTKVSATWK